jgi:hypothetical protein
MPAHEEEVEDIMLIFQEELGDAVLIGTSVLETDVSLRLEKLSGDPIRQASCLLLGSAEEKDWETNKPVIYNHMLVVQPSPEVRDAWERIGVLSIKKEAAVHVVLSEKTFKLV